MERLIGRVVYGSAGGRDLVSLRASMERIPAVKAQLAAFPSGALHQLDQQLEDPAALIG